MIRVFDSNKIKMFFFVFNPAICILTQAILSICISMSFFCIGLVRGYSAPAVPSIMENDPDLLPTKNIASWASMFINRKMKDLFFKFRFK